MEGCSGMTPPHLGKRARKEQPQIEAPEKATWSEENKKWKQVAYEFRHVPGTMGGFHFHLCEAIVRADLANSALLRKVYPELVHWIQEEDL